MRLPDPIANTTTEAYLAYKAGVLAEGDLKPKLYEPYIHLDAWLAYWAGLTNTYPIKGVGKNLFNKNSTVGIMNNTFIGSSDIGVVSGGKTLYIPCGENTTYTISKISSARFIAATTEVKPENKVAVADRASTSGTSLTITTSPNAKYLVLFYYLASADTVTEESILDSIQIEKGSTATAYEPYTGEPEMLTDEEAYIAYLSGVTDTYPEEFRDPADIRVAAYLRYLISARWGRPEYPVTNEELYLSMLKTQYIPSGDPSSDIVINGTAKAPFVDVKMYGDTKQQSYTGKNLAYPETGSGVYNGLKATYNPSTHEITVTGTPTTTWSIPFLSFTQAALTLPAGTYTLKQRGTLTNGKIGVNLRNGNTVLAEREVDSSSLEKTFTISSDANGGYLFLGSMTAGQAVSGTITVQLEAGSTATDFEPFVGGQPSPSPEYPQPIQTVTGKQTVKVLGKNLLNITSPMREVTNAGLHITIADDGKITIDGTATGAIWPDFIWGIQNNTVSHNSCKYYFPKALEAVTCSIKIVNGTVTGTPSVSVIFNDDGGKNVGIRLGQPQVRTATDVNGINRVFLNGVQSGTIFNNFQFYLQIESGTTATEVVPYSSTDYPISLGSIELCKLGTYQDYIWKDGDDWKVHKATANITLDTSGWSKSNATANNVYINQNIPNLVKGSPLVATNLTTYGSSDIYSRDIVGICYNTTGAGLASIRIGVGLSGASTINLFKSWLESNPVTTYYALAATTDTVIADQSLISQLDALEQGGAEDGTTYIKVSATDPNLPGLLYVEAPKYE